MTCADGTQVEASRLVTRPSDERARRGDCGCVRQLEGGRRPRWLEDDDLALTRQRFRTVANSHCPTSAVRRRELGHCCTSHDKGSDIADLAVQVEDRSKSIS